MAEMWSFKPVPPIDDPGALALFSTFSDEDLEDASLTRPEGADDDTELSDVGLLIAQPDPMRGVAVDAVMLVDVEELMVEAGAPEAEIERVFEDVGDDDMRLVIWSGGTRFWVGALRATRVRASSTGIGQA